MVPVLIGFMLVTHGTTLQYVLSGEIAESIHL